MSLKTSLQIKYKNRFHEDIQVLMQCQKSGKEQKYFSTFQAIGRVTREEGVRKIFLIQI